MKRGVLLMAYGSPESPEEVEPYYQHIRGGRAPSREAVTRLQERYAVVGGKTPLREITEQVRTDLERVLQETPGDSYAVYVGMKHWHPFIAGAVNSAAMDGVEKLTAVALAPHYSRMSIGGYRKAVETALADSAASLDLAFVDSWHLHPEFVRLIAGRITSALDEWPDETRAAVKVVFSAHSLPVRIREWSDPYEEQLLESCRAVSAVAAHDNWTFAWQSAGETGEPWLGPDILDVLGDVHSRGVNAVLSVPIGFVSDHLEIQYDIDYEAANKARDLGMKLARTPMPNADPAFISLLASVVTEAG